VALIPEAGLRLLGRLSVVVALYAEGLRWWVLRPVTRLVSPYR
jgi:hypothetical protein